MKATLEQVRAARRLVLMGLSIPFFLFHLSVTRAQEAPGRTVIDIGYEQVFDRISPTVSHGTTHVSFQVVLTGKNHVEEKIEYTDGGASMKQNYENALGSDSNHASWRVLPHNVLQRTRDFWQSVRIITVRVLPNKTCALNVIDRLKPGYSDYLYMNFRGVEQHFSRFENTDFQCSIR